MTIPVIILVRVVPTFTQEKTARLVNNRQRKCKKEEDVRKEKRVLWDLQTPLMRNPKKRLKM